MHPKLKLKIYEAMERVIEDNCDDGLWDGYVHPDLTTQMTEAAALVFDSSMEGQRYAKQENQ
jgi:hypothetical protein